MLACTLFGRVPRGVRALFKCNRVPFTWGRPQVAESKSGRVASARAPSLLAVHCLLAFALLLGYSMASIKIASLLLKTLSKPSELSLQPAVRRLS